MDYKEALKKVQAVKVKDNFMCIKLTYDTKLILPHKDALLFLSSLAAAEQLNDPYNKPHTIGELDRSKIEVTTLSYLEYERFKIAALLNITVDEVKEAQLQAQAQGVA